MNPAPGSKPNRVRHRPKTAPQEGGPISRYAPYRYAIGSMRTAQCLYEGWREYGSKAAKVSLLVVA